MRRLLQGVIVILVLSYALQNGFYAYRQIFRNVRFIALNPQFSYDDKMRIYWWGVYDFLLFVKASTPKDATIVIPPQDRPWLTSGNAAIVRYFLYPRKVINGSLTSLPDSQYDYIFINAGEWPDAPIEKYNWPKIAIESSRIIYFDPQTKNTNIVSKNFSPSDISNIGAYGLIEVKK